MLHFGPLYTNYVYVNGCEIHRVTIGFTVDARVGDVLVDGLNTTTKTAQRSKLSFTRQPSDTHKNRPFQDCHELFRRSGRVG